VAVPAAVQHILLENFRMFVADVIGEESNVLGSGESAIVKRTKHVRRVEEKQVNFHVGFVELLSAVTAAEQVAGVLDFRFFSREVPQEVIFVDAATFNHEILVVSVVMRVEVFLIAVHDGTIGAGVHTEMRRDRFEVLVRLLVDHVSFEVLEADAAANIVAGWFALVRLHVLLKFHEIRQESSTLALESCLSIGFDEFCAQIFVFNFDFCNFGDFRFLEVVFGVMVIVVIVVGVHYRLDGVHFFLLNFLDFHVLEFHVDDFWFRRKFLFWFRLSKFINFFLDILNLLKFFTFELHDRLDDGISDAWIVDWHERNDELVFCCFDNRLCEILSFAEEDFEFVDDI
jgi:hypothetical protein